MYNICKYKLLPYHIITYAGMYAGMDRVCQNVVPLVITYNSNVNKILYNISISIRVLGELPSLTHN